MTDGRNGFDFIYGSWRVLHRKLAARLVGSSEWYEFEGTMTSRPIMGGQGNVDDYVLPQPTGLYRAAAVRGFDPERQQWSIWWLDSRYPTSLGTPVIGRFEDDMGAFYSEEVVDGRRLIGRFLWTRIRTPSPKWEQALSTDGGQTWETNWSFELVRVAA